MYVYIYIYIIRPISLLRLWSNVCLSTNIRSIRFPFVLGVIANDITIRPISLLTLSLLTLLDSNFLGNSLGAWEFHPS